MKKILVLSMVVCLTLVGCNCTNASEYDKEVWVKVYGECVRNVNLVRGFDVGRICSTRADEAIKKMNERWPDQSFHSD